ncbi:MAG: hypothetical protein P0Y65_14025 [Candidatus Devosia phytovorans]|uniref:Uncharacterized protein n=1 Tax=Candidatus Devosia phytovorans TaxID=3121372 RepID=A0AAJ6AZ11_9HYPH|nr:hypothetical protein [Devosia sp.]WEK03306.1 MAG: hypothetical protein P0Y65_14025 [Devosia sp.]
MATAPKQPVPTVASVDNLIDENGARIDVPDASPIKVAGEHEETIAATGPTNWWLYGVVGLAIVIAVLFLMQMFQGAPSTDVQPGTPSAESVVAPAADPAVPVQEQVVPAN